MAKRFIVIGNWKMNKTQEQALEFARSLPPLIAPNYLAVPFTCLQLLCDLDIPMLKIGAQNVHPHQEGAFTGEISPPMVKSTGAQFVLVGHSERRHFFHESNEFVNKKIKACLLEDLVPVLCLGESAMDREEGHVEDVLKKQLFESLFEVESQSFSKLMIAYEPIWAIGTGKPATAQAVQEVHFLLRKLIREKWGSSAAEAIFILYGGSVTADTMKNLIKQPDIDGVLVGGASLKVETYSQIIHSVGGHS